MELRRQCLALDLSDRFAPRSARVGSRGVDAIADCAGYGNRGRVARNAEHPNGAWTPRISLSKLACMAPLARINVHDLCADLDFQRLAFNGPWLAISTGKPTATELVTIAGACGANYLHKKPRFCPSRPARSNGSLSAGRYIGASVSISIRSA